VLEWQRRLEDGHGRVDIAELCRVFGVSRQTGYVWIRRFREASHDVRAMEDRSRRPRTSPTAVPREVEDLVVDLRKHRPKWGPRKLRAWLIDRYPGRQFPSASSVATILKRNGLATARRRRRRPHVPRLGVPLGAASAPNEIWCIDFKGHFRTLDREWCYPLTIVDAFCRFCIRCESVIEPSPCRLVDVQPGPWAHRLVVDEHGTIRWGRRRIFVSHALVGQMLGATPDAGSRWILHFGGIEIGSFDGTNIRPELRASPRSRRAHYTRSVRDVIGLICQGCP